MAERGARIAGGALAATVGVLAPLRENLLPLRLAGGERGERAGNRTRTWRTWAGFVCLAATTVILLAAPQLAIAGRSLSLALLLALLPLLDGAVWAFDRTQMRLRGVSPYLAVDRAAR